jgi:hypothetical protein
MAQARKGPTAGEMAFTGGNGVQGSRLLLTRRGSLSNNTNRTAPKLPGRAEKVQASLGHSGRIWCVKK